MADSTWDSVRWLQSPQNYCRHLIENARKYVMQASKQATSIASKASKQVNK